MYNDLLMVNQMQSYHKANEILGFFQKYLRRLLYKALKLDIICSTGWDHVLEKQVAEERSTIFRSEYDTKYLEQSKKVS